MRYRFVDSAVNSSHTPPYIPVSKEVGVGKVLKSILR